MHASSLEMNEVVSRMSLEQTSFRLILRSSDPRYEDGSPSQENHCIVPGQDIFDLLSPGEHKGLAVDGLEYRC